MELLFLDTIWKNHASIIKGSSDPSHFILEFNVGKCRIRYRTTLEFLDRLKIDLRFFKDSNSEFLYLGSDSFRHSIQK